MGRLTHVAIFTWKPETTEAQRAALCDGLAALPGLIPAIRSYRFGADAGLVVGNDQFAVVADFDDAEAYWRYAADPRHVDVVERLLKPMLRTRHAIQFTPSEDGVGASEP